MGSDPMRPPILPLATVVAFALCGALVAGAQPGSDAPATVPEALAADLHLALTQWAAVPGHRGVTAAVVLPGGARWTGAAGLAGDGEPMRPEHLIGIASITKTMTGAVISSSRYMTLNCLSTNHARSWRFRAASRR